MSPAIEKVSRDFFALLPDEQINFLKTVITTPPGQLVSRRRVGNVVLGTCWAAACCWSLVSVWGDELPCPGIGTEGLAAATSCGVGFVCTSDGRGLA